jgi:afadin
MQLRALLTRYIPDNTEPPVTQSFVERVVVIAENMADELTRTDGREVSRFRFSFDLTLSPPAVKTR